MDKSVLLEAVKISGIGIVVLLLVLILLAFVVWLMTRFMIEKPEAESEPEMIQPERETEPEKKSDLENIAVLAVALARAQAEIVSSESSTPVSALNAWQQFNLQRRLTQSSNIRRSR